MIERTYSSHKRVISIGGGSGQFTFLRGLVEENQPEGNTAVAGPWDDGGISGEQRVREGVLPPGDYTQCILGLMESDEQLKEAFLILKDRSEGYPLTHLLAARSEKAHHGVEEGINGLRRLFRIRGRVLLTTLSDTDLNTVTKNGVHFNREHNLDDLEKDPNFSLVDEVTSIYLDPEVHANPKVLEAIEESDLIVFPAGSPYGSIFPHLLIQGIPEAILNSKAKLVLVLNLMTTKGQDHHLTTASRWLRVFQHYLGDDDWVKETGRSRINYLLANENHIDPEIVEIYRNKGQNLVEVDKGECEHLAPGLEVVRQNLAEYVKSSHLLRHNPQILARAVLGLS